jgi:hypothetical protein
VAAAAVGAAAAPLGLDDQPMHPLAGTRLGSRVAGKEAWRHCDAGRNDDHELTWWHYNVTLKKGDCPTDWHIRLFKFFKGRMRAEHCHAITERPMPNGKKANYRMKKSDVEGLHAHALTLMKCPVDTKCCARIVVKGLIANELGVEPGEVSQGFVALCEGKNHDEIFMVGYMDKA